MDSYRQRRLDLHSSVTMERMECMVSYHHSVEMSPYEVSQYVIWRGSFTFEVCSCIYTLVPYLKENSMLMS